MGSKVINVFKEKNKECNRCTLKSYKNLYTENKFENLVQEESFSVDETNYVSEIYQTKWTTSIQEDFVVFSSAVEGKQNLVQKKINMLQKFV